MRIIQGINGNPIRGGRIGGSKNKRGSGNSKSSLLMLNKNVPHGNQPTHIGAQNVIQLGENSYNEFFVGNMGILHYT
jgi:hypothetical protein